MQVNQQQLFSGDTFLSRDAFNENKKQVPASYGIYAWYFKGIPTVVPVDDCHMIGDKTLLYIGISPSSNTSKNNLRKRIMHHFNGNGGSSTLRKSLGYKLEGKTFKTNEKKLSEWMSKNAYVKFVEIEEPWKYESELIHKYSLPLNLECNKQHEFYNQLKQIRKDCK